MKKKLYLVFTFLFACNLYAQNVEKIRTINEIKYHSYPGGGSSVFPEGLYFNEVENIAVCFDAFMDEFYNIDFNDTTNDFIKKEKGSIPYYPTMIKVGNDYWGVGSKGLTYILNGEKYKSISDVTSGISFILKKDSGYIVYYVNERGIPGAVDTEGKVYRNVEAMEYLKAYDPEKYGRSEKRAVELGLKGKFDLYEVLIWGDTYYSTYKILTKYWKPETYLFGNADQPIQYDLQGNGYGTNIRYEGVNSNICIVNPNGERVKRILLQDSSSILSASNVANTNFTSSWYVGFGGNIYYYIANEEYTEVFRIRRTWGNPDFYALAINGYTEDEYGKYVTDVLSKMSKADLRLLRNTIFALYGVHFKSEDLAKYFDKQVWYTDEGKSSGEVTLPENRQKLVEMILKLEK